MATLQRSIRRALLALVVVAASLVGVAVAAPDRGSGSAQRTTAGAPAGDDARDTRKGRTVARAAQDAPAQLQPAPAPASPPAWEPDVRAARAYARSRQGVVSFSLRTPDGSWGFRGNRVARSASVVKAMLLVAYLSRNDVRRRALTGGERALLAPMIQWSSNDAASTVHGQVGDLGLRRVATRAGMRAFVSAPAWGQSSITAADQSRFFLRIDRLVPPRHRAYALRLLRTIVAEQRWGLGRVVPRGWRLYLKGGWGAGTGAVNHQVALLRRGDERVAVVILTTDNPSHAYGSETLHGVGQRLLRGLSTPVESRPEEGPRSVTAAEPR